MTLRRSSPEQVAAWRARSRQLARSRKPISTRSDRRRAAQPVRADVRAAVLARDGWRCQAEGVAYTFARGIDGPWWPSFAAVKCGGPLDCHEIIPRSAWAAGYLVESNVVAVCRSHHSWIGDNPRFAHVLGLHGFASERPDSSYMRSPDTPKRARMYSRPESARTPSGPSPTPERDRSEHG